jgi:methylated-DNA-[protein]-cysteine S-methyltransferase
MTDLDLVTARFVARALEEELVDVAYAYEDSPIGRLTLAATPLGVVRIGFDGEDAMVAELARDISPRVLLAPARLDAVRRELAEYFAGTRTSFDAPVDRRLSHGFFRAAQEAISAIPYGHVASYKDIAGAAGNVNATRAAGTACRTNPIPIIVPCHRVLRTGGGIGGYAGGLAAKHFLLALEGLELVG